MKPFLDTNWTNLLVANYRVRPEHVDFLREHLPAGTELDDYHGEHYVSIVAFEFKNTRILGIPMPFYRNFAEINLRFYVRRKVNGSWRRGVVFIKEIVPCKLPALIANKIFKENFHVHPLSCDLTNNKLTYQWECEGYKQSMETTITPDRQAPEPGSFTEHIIDHYWAYKRINDTTTGEFKVTHRPWKVSECPNAKMNIDLKKVYGQKWAKALVPTNTFYADGSQVQVTKPEILNPKH